MKKKGRGELGKGSARGVGEDVVEKGCKTVREKGNTQRRKEMEIHPERREKTTPENDGNNRGSGNADSTGREKHPDQGGARSSPSHDFGQEGQN
jgi:hypothetical protein